MAGVEAELRGLIDELKRKIEDLSNQLGEEKRKIEDMRKAGGVVRAEVKAKNVMERKEFKEMVGHYEGKSRTELEHFIYDIKEFLEHDEGFEEWLDKIENEKAEVTDERMKKVQADNFEWDLDWMNKQLYTILAARCRGTPKEKVMLL